MTEKRTLYVGGLSEEVTKELLFSAFVPFGEVTDVQIARDPGNSEPYLLPLSSSLITVWQLRVVTSDRKDQHKGFGFVEFEEASDAAAAIDNMNHAEILGRTIFVNVANEKSAMRTRASLCLSSLSLCGVWTSD